jgi:bridging integrator 3
MSWYLSSKETQADYARRSGFKKAVNRAGTSVMMKTGHVEKTINRDYEIEERRFRTMESAANRLQKEAKGYLDSLRGVFLSNLQSDLQQ